MEQVILSYLERGDRKITFKSFLMSTGQFLHKVTLPDHNGVTPLHHLARQYAQTKSPDLSIKIINVMYYLVKMGANMELTDVNGNSPYHLVTPGQPLFWEMAPYCCVDFEGGSADYFSNTKSISIFNRYFTRPSTLYAKNRFDIPDFLGPNSSSRRISTISWQRIVTGNMSTSVCNSVDRCFI